MPQTIQRTHRPIELPAAVRGELERRLAELRPVLPPARWVRADNVHLTLVFLGDITPSQETALTARLEAVFRRSAAFDLRLDRAGSFPPRRPARVAWIGLSASTALSELQAAVSDVCREEVSLEPERRPYRPHLTLARCRRSWPAAAARDWRRGWDGHLDRSFAVREGVLMESRLGAGGADYLPRARMPLGGSR